MGERSSFERRHREWWDGWWAKDFSWDGLANKPYDGWFVLSDGSLVEEPVGDSHPTDRVRPASQQDYWRDQEGDLIVSPNGTQRFTRVHLPPFWADGTPTGKADWPQDALDPILAPKLLAGGPTRFARGVFGREVEGPDRRTQLQGCVLLRACNHPLGGAGPLFVRLDLAAFLRDAVFDTATFVSVSTFEAATFLGDASFNTVTFSGDASFYRATFSGEARFISATFSGGANFNRTSFESDVSFMVATFSEGVSFNGAAFSSESSFYQAVFSGVARFVGVAFSSAARFGEANFSGDAEFSGALFKGNAIFAAAKFAGDLSFAGAEFDKSAVFERVGWPTSPQNWHRAFDQTWFKPAPVFTRAGFKSLGAFDGAVLERGIQIDDPGATKSDTIFRAELDGAIKAAEADMAGWVDKQTEGRKKGLGEVEGKEAVHANQIGRTEFKRQLAEFRNSRLAELERGCRTLKKAMEYESNKTREQLFYRYELIARRAQGTTPLSEKVFSYLYGWLGNYGASIGRPFIAVTVLTLLFSVAYWGLDIGLAYAAGHAIILNPIASLDPDFERALSFSASRIFPFGAFEDISQEWLQAYEKTHGAIAGLWLRILASIQSIIALTLVFMVGLAVRRKFQIS
jgi:uncharacterized protein YjbI with pentapeptide repeats